MTEVDIAIQSLQLQRNEALDAVVNLRVENHKLELKVAELEAKLNKQEEISDGE